VRAGAAGYHWGVDERPIHPARLDDEMLLRQCQTGRGRSAGPGGQHRNKVETAVILTHTPTGVVGQASERRSQLENKKKALKRLRHNLAVELRYPVPDGDARSELWRSRAHGGKLSVNPHHHDYPALLAEALDMLASCGWDPKKAALRLDVTTSQLLRLLRHHPPAMEQLNQARQDRRKHTIK
jgi:hypothetical protein